MLAIPYRTCFCSDEHDVKFRGLAFLRKQRIHSVRSVSPLTDGMLRCGRATCSHPPDTVGSDVPQRAGVQRADVDVDAVQLGAAQGVSRRVQVLGDDCFALNGIQEKTESEYM